MYSNHMTYESAGDEQHQQRTTHDYISGVPAHSGVDDLTNVSTWGPLHGPGMIPSSNNDPHFYAATQHIEHTEHVYTLSTPPSTSSTISGSHPASDHPAIADVYNAPLESPGYIASHYASPELSQIGSLAESMDLPAPGYCNDTTIESFGLSALTTRSAFMSPPYLGGYPDYLVPSSSSHAPQQHRRPSLSSDFPYDHASESVPDLRPRQHRSAEGILIASRSPDPIQVQRRISAPSPLPISPSATSPSLSPTPRRRPSNFSHSSSFPCALAPYGCTSTFASKNEWKRHVATQHLRLDLWRCDICPSSPRSSSSSTSSRPQPAERHLHIFNRKDLFVQHLRRMHPSSIRPSSSSDASTAEQSEDTLIAIAEKRCRKRLRHPPSRSCCPFCGSGFANWDARMEHVGRHMEWFARHPVSVAARSAAAAAAAGGGGGSMMAGAAGAGAAVRSPVDGRWESLPPLQQWDFDRGFHSWLQEERIIVFEGGGWRLADARR